MKLELHSVKDDVFEVETGWKRPMLKICEIYFDGAYHPWHWNWENLVIDDFVEDFEIVKEKIVDYYKAENLSCRLPREDCIDDTPVYQRRPGWARLSATGEEWELRNCKIVGCDIDNENKKIRLELKFDEAGYKSYGKV
jgi:hypothetical protein